MRVLRRPRALTAALIAGALLAGGAPGALAVVGERSAETPIGGQSDGDARTDEPGLELVVAPETPIVDSGATEVKFTVLLRNAGELSAPEGSVELAIGDRLTGSSAIPRPEELAATADAPPLDDAADASSEKTDAGGQGADAAAEGAAPLRTVLATAAIDAIAGGKEQTATVTVPLSDIPAFTPTTHGVYPVYATYRASDSGAAASLSAFTPVVWSGPHQADAAVDLTSIVPLTLSTKVQSLPTRAQLGSETPRLEELVDFATRTQSVLAIDPRYVAAVRAYGTEAPQAARDLVARLESTALPNFMLQFGDADPAAQAAMGATELLGPNGFEFVTRFGAWEPDPEPEAPGDAPEASGGAAGAHRAASTATTPGTTADDADDAGAEGDTTDPADADDAGADGTDPDPEERGAVPTDEALTAWPGGLAGAWPGPGQADSRTLTLLREAALDFTVLRSDNVTLTGGPRATLGDTGTALVTDAELDAAVQLALAGETEAERALGAAGAAARLALAADADVAGLVLGVDRGGAATNERPERVISELTTQRWIKPVAHTAQAAGNARLQPGTAAEERVELLAEAVGNEPTVLEARATLVNPEYLDSYQRMRLLTLFATRHSGPDADFADTATQFAKRDAELHDGVRLVGTKRAQLVGGSTKIPIQLRNSLPFDAVVTLEVSPTSAALRLPERTFHDILLPEDSSERVLVPATSRVSSGDSALLLSVTSADGEYTASTGRLEVTISSAVETVAIALLGTAAALLFGFGIWRSIRRRRTLSAGE